MEYWTAERIWPDSTIVCIGGGPSLTKEQVEYCHGKARVIAINDAYRIAPWADILYFCDDKWWEKYGHGAKLANWQGMIVRLEGKEGSKQDFGDKRIKVMRNMDVPAIPGQKPKGGLCDQRDGLRTGKNSGYQAINLAVHLGAKLILLIGYDMGATRDRTHWFGDHPGGTSPKVYDDMLPFFDALPKALAAKGVQVVNCTGGGRLIALPRKRLQDALPQFEDTNDRQDRRPCESAAQVANG